MSPKPEVRAMIDALNEANRKRAELWDAILIANFPEPNSYLEDMREEWLVAETALVVARDALEKANGAKKADHPT